MAEMRFEYSSADSLYVLLTVLMMVAPALSYLVMSGTLVGLVRRALTKVPFVDAHGPVPLCPGEACARMRRSIGCDAEGEAGEPQAGAEKDGAASAAGAGDTDDAACDHPRRSPRAGRPACVAARVEFYARRAMYAAWALVAVCVVAVKLIPNTVVIFDPYAVLGISSSASKIEAKRAYRKLSLTKHPDKVAFHLREAASRNFSDIIKAYKVLTDAKARENWERYGNPDGPRGTSFGIALPPWMQDGRFVFVSYVTIIGAVGLLVRVVLKKMMLSKDNMRTSSDHKYIVVAQGFTPLCSVVVDAIAAIPENKLTIDDLFTAIANDPTPLENYTDESIGKSGSKKVRSSSNERQGKLSSRSSSPRGAKEKKSASHSDNESSSNPSPVDDSASTSHGYSAPSSNSPMNVMLSYKKIYASVKQYLPSKAKHTPRLVYLYAHLMRKNLVPRKDVVGAALSGCVVAINIAYRRGSLEDIFTAIEATRLLTSARQQDTPLLMQLPYIRKEFIEAPNSAVAAVEGNLAELFNSACSLRNGFGLHFTKPQYDEVKNSVAAAPIIKINSAECVDARDRKGLDAGSTNCLLLVKISTVASVVQSQPSAAHAFVCAPYYPGALRNGAWVILCSSSAVFATKFVPFEENQLELEAEVEFSLTQIPALNLKLSVHVVSPYYCAADEFPLQVRVKREAAKRKTKASGKSGDQNAKNLSNDDNNETLLANFG